MKPEATVLICTYNPRMETLGRVLDALRSQTKPVHTWELLVVDNGSAQALTGRLELAWHPAARVLHEPRVGKTRATLLGFTEARSDLIIIVDDDNVLCPTYISDAVSVGKHHSFLGAWGGVSRGEFEVPPPQWALSRLSFIAVRDNDCPRPVWTNEYFRPPATPIGAGLCVRKTVTDAYSAMLRKDSSRQALGPNGSALSRCEDIDLAYTAIDIGFGLGRFPELVLTHVIPAERLSETYFLNLVEASTESHILLRALRNSLPERDSLPRRFLNFLRWLPATRIEKRFARARRRGIAKGFALAQSLNTDRHS